MPDFRFLLAPFFRPETLVPLLRMALCGVQDTQDHDEENALLPKHATGSPMRRVENRVLYRTCWCRQALEDKPCRCGHFEGFPKQQWVSRCQYAHSQDEKREAYPKSCNIILVVFARIESILQLNLKGSELDRLIDETFKQVIVELEARLPITIKALGYTQSDLLAFDVIRRRCKEKRKSEYNSMLIASCSASNRSASLDPVFA